jgi:flavoprotein
MEKIIKIYGLVLKIKDNFKNKYNKIFSLTKFANDINKKITMTMNIYLIMAIKKDKHN